MTKLRELAVEVLINRVEPLLKLSLSELANGVMGRVVVHIGQENGLGERRFDMFS